MANLAVESLSEAKRRILWRLKQTPEATAPTLAHEFGLTDTAIRQHLDALEAIGLVERRTDRPHGRGRPPELWSVTREADRCFPNRHGDLAVATLRAVRETFGEEGLSTVLAKVMTEQRSAYEYVLPPIEEQSLGERLAEFIRLRGADGFLTEMTEEPTSSGESYLIVEHHCPVIDAARSCGSLCAQERELVQSLFGPDTEVTALGTLAEGDASCTYRVRPVPNISGCSTT